MKTNVFLMACSLAATLALALPAAATGTAASLAAAATTSAAATETPAGKATREIAALLSRLQVSPCRFERNGSWYDGAKAAAHLQRKYDYAVDHGTVFASAEEFIDGAASRSSLSGRDYRVQCGDAAPVPAATWFLGRLRELRAS